MRIRLALMLAAGTVSLAGAPVAEAGTASRPNVVVVVTDDQPASTANARTMPSTMRLIARRGARFTRSIVSTPVCCPSRATLLTGQFGHNNGVLWNNPGYPDLDDPANTLPVWLRRAGYRTVHVGKWLNGYKHVVPDTAVAPPGWSQWRTALEPIRYYDYVLGVNGRRIEHGSKRRDYITRVLNRQAARMVRRFGDRGRPLFMLVDQFAPHAWPGPGLANGCRAPGVEPDYRDRRRFKRVELPDPPSFDEADVSDKPSFIRARPRVTKADVKLRSRWHRCVLASLRAVDRGVERIWRELGRIGQRRNTAIVFTSDNGFYFGEHRVFVGKELPYREGLEVPLAIRLPPTQRPKHARGLRVRRLVGNVDLAPTILELAKADPCASPLDCRVLDGRSLLGLARGRDGSWPDGRALPLELDVGPPTATPNVSCSFQGLWVGRETYLHHTAATTPERDCVPVDESEHYDLRTDPHQLENLFPAAPGSAGAARQAALAARAEALAGCSGIAGRDPAPPGGSSCE